MFSEPAHRPIEYNALEIMPDLDHVLRPHRVIDTLDPLLDDWALVEVSCHEMRGRANYLDPALVRLVIRLCALETWQERMVNIDDTFFKLRTELRRKNLHIARQSEQIGA